MDKTDIILWAIGGGFTALFALLGFMWSALNAKMDQRCDKIEQRFDKLDAKVEDVDRRLCRIEGGLASNSYCSLANLNQNGKRKHHV